MNKLTYGLQVTLIGMGIVFVILFVLSLLMDVMRQVFYKNKKSSDKKAKEPAKAKQKPKQATKQEENQEELIAVITAAIAHSRSTSIPFKVASIKRIEKSSTVPVWALASRTNPTKERRIPR